MFETPVLLIIYKRKDTIETLVNQLRLLKPKNIFVAADGPKNELDIIKCIETRKVIDSIDWDCNINTLFQEKNLGVALGPKTAIDWFFKENEMGIIFEDDILPSLDFFPFCEELLNKYKDNPRIMHISSMNFHFGKNVVNNSYYFSNVISPWGWASWRRAWEKFDFFIHDLHENIDKLEIPLFYKTELINYKKTLENYKNNNELYAWDYQWLYCVLKNNAMGIVPSKNLALNIGFNTIDASNTFSAPNWVKKMSLGNLTITKHPKTLEVDKWADELTFKEIVGNYKPNYFLWLKRKLNQLF